jgi:membrane protein YdbS with pleckstrin-like domain
MASGTRINSRILERYVLPDERIVVANRHHWARMLEPVGTMLLGFVAVAFVSGRLEAAIGEAALFLWWVWFLLVARLIWKALEWRNEWFVATDKRLLMTYGLITHRVAMMPIRKVTDMNYARSPVSRVLGYGQFLLESAGQDQAMRKIDWVVDPDQTYRLLCDTLFGSGGHDPDEDPMLPWGEDADTAPRRARDTLSRREPTDRGWEVSSESASAYQPIASGYQPISTWEGLRRPSRGRRRQVADDPDITGPIPPPPRQVD